MSEKWAQPVEGFRPQAVVTMFNVRGKTSVVLRAGEAQRPPPRDREGARLLADVAQVRVVRRWCVRTHRDRRRGGEHPGGGHEGREVEDEVYRAIVYERRARDSAQEERGQVTQGTAIRASRAQPPGEDLRRRALGGPVPRGVAQVQAPGRRAGVRGEGEATCAIRHEQEPCDSARGVAWACAKDHKPSDDDGDEEQAT